MQALFFFCVHICTIRAGCVPGDLHARPHPTLLREDTNGLKMVDVDWDSGIVPGSSDDEDVDVFGRRHPQRYILPIQAAAAAILRA